MHVSTGKICCITFNNIDLSEREVYALGHRLNVSLQISLGQHSELVKQRSDVISIDGDEYLQTQEDRKYTV